MPCNNKQSIHRSDRWSILPAMDINGYLSNVLVKQGGVTADDFIEWVEKYVLPQTRPSQILVMDNCRIHRDDRLAALVVPYGVSIQYLPPYSPDFNPIERSFCKLKAFIKRHNNLISDIDDFGQFLLIALNCFKALYTRRQFEKCGYNMD